MRWELSAASKHVNAVAKALGLDEPGADVQIANVLVIHEAQTIPEPGQAFTFYGYRFEILRKSRNKITAIRVRPIGPADKPNRPSHESDAMEAG